LVQAQIQEAIGANPKLRTAALQVRARVWADATGRVTRVQIVTSSGDAELDAALNHEVLSTLTLREPPPRDMPMPIVMQIIERKSG
jgi:TonB family protein